MPLINQTTLRNHLLRQLRPEDFALLAPHLKLVDLRKGEVLSEPNQPFTHAVFPEQAIGSIIAMSPDGQMVEAGLFGRDGVSPMDVALGAESSPLRLIIQVSGEGYRMPAEVLRGAIDASRPLHTLLLAYVQALNVQTSYTALSNAVHPVDERLARWLLMCHDRSPSDEMALTHEFLGIMLAVRRPSVTSALHVLEGNRLIWAERGRVTIRDRRRLEEFARDAYRLPDAEYERLVKPLGVTSSKVQTDVGSMRH